MVRSIKAIILSIVLIFSLYMFINTDKVEVLERTDTYSELRSKEILKVGFIIVTPCYEERCYDFNEEILDKTEEFYKEYGIEIEFERVFLEIEEPVSLDIGLETNLTLGYIVKIELMRETGDTERPHIIHSPMFVGWDPSDPESHILGIANTYLELIVLKQQMIDNSPIEEEFHVLAHEIGHIFGLEDHYDEETRCDLMYGYTNKEQLDCELFTDIQVEHMRNYIKTFLLK